MTKLKPFLFEGDTLVRMVDLGDDKVWMVAKDVAEPLGYKNPREAVRLHCKHARPLGEETISPPSLDPQTVIIPESDVFRLIFRSRLPAAQRFEAWVMEEVLPSIRRIGAYQVAEPSPVQPVDPIADRPWRERPAEERNTELRTIAHIGRFGNHALAFWYMSEVAKVAPFPKHLLSPWQQSLGFPPGGNQVTVIMPGGHGD